MILAHPEMNKKVKNEYPLVSIIIITYNDRKYIGNAIDSALGQTYPNCEIIVVDDGSTDNTSQFIAEKFNDRVKYFWKENGGQGSARSLGLKKASGEYIQHLDSDDLLLPDKIKNQVHYLKTHPNIAFVYGRSLCFFDEDLSSTWEHPCNLMACSGNLLNKILEYGNFVNVGQPLTRSSWVAKVGGFDLTIRDADDYDFMLRLAYSGAIGHFLDESVYLYRHHRVSTNKVQMVARHSNFGQMQGEVYLWERMHTIMQHDSHPYLALAKKRLGEVYIQLGRIQHIQGIRKKAIQNIYRGLQLNSSRWVYKVIILTESIFLPVPISLKIKNNLKLLMNQYNFPKKSNFL
jgi:glycosyltransferase involved in cell wall biosynthesis